MIESGTISVRKKNGQIQPFDTGKLAGCIWRSVDAVGGEYQLAWEIARAVEIYLRRKDRDEVTSSAVFEMCLKALRRVKIGEAAEVMELQSALRSIRRRLLRIDHGNGKISHWDKNWLVTLGRQIWQLSVETVRIIASEIELEILPSQQEKVLTREEICKILNEKVVQFGLADALPVDHSIKF